MQAASLRQMIAALAASAAESAGWTGETVAGCVRAIERGFT
jgi:hypothetical protein